ncbi:MAG: MBL fold metallo-hydrolase [Campylobacterota bacterium]|nr:MBL fold metallo-hydrolase [Campylobacterota bacterium]
MLNKIIAPLLIASVSVFGFDYKLEPKKVAPNVWCFFGKLEMPTKQNGGNMSNSCYIKTEKSFVLVDAGPTYKFAQQAYAAMNKIANLPVSLVINTHDHDDHWLGSGFYKEKFNAKLVGTSTINTNYTLGDKTRMFHLLSANAVEGTKIVKLDEQVQEIKTIKVSGTKIMIMPIGVKAHSSEDLFVYLPDDKVLFAGDVVMNGRITSNRDGSVIGQLKALEMINQQGWEVLVPGHGFDTSKTATDEAVQYFTLLKKYVMEAVEEDVGPEGVNKMVSMSEFKDHAMYKDLNSRNVFDAYGELEFYEED